MGYENKLIKIIFGLRKLKRIGLPFTDKVKTDEEQVLGGGCKVFGFRHTCYI